MKPTETEAEIILSLIRSRMKDRTDPTPPGVIHRTSLCDDDMIPTMTEEDLDAGLDHDEVRERLLEARGLVHRSLWQARAMADEHGMEREDSVLALTKMILQTYSEIQMMENL